MKLITTEITAQKLKESRKKGSISPSFDYSTPLELEARYRAFSLEARSQLEAQIKPILRHSQSNVKFERNEEFKSILKSSYKRYIDENRQNKLNIIVKYCGSVLMASIFDALIIKGIEDISNKRANIDNDNNCNTQGLSDKLLKAFGIDGYVLKGYKKFEEKRKYLINSMGVVIEKLLKSWKERIETREKNYEGEEKRERNKENFENSFDFLKLKTGYEALRKKLTGTVVQKLNDYENQIKIVHTLKQREERRATLQTIHHDELKVNFTNIEKIPSFHSHSLSKFTTPSTSYVKRPSVKQFNANFLAFNYAKHEGISQQSRNMSTILTSEILEDSFKAAGKDKNGGSVSPRSRRPNISHSLHVNTGNLNQYLKENADKGIDINEKYLKAALVWDKGLEKEFQEAKFQGKTLFFDEVKKNNWDFLAIRNLVQKLFTEEKKNTQRIEKMKRYGEGDYLTAEELKFLADSSELLNACVDKKYLQTAVNIIDEGNLHYIELNLAEKIIRKYDEMKDIITKARFSYFSKRNTYITANIQAFNDRKVKQMRHGEMCEKGKRYKKMMGTICQLIDVKNQMKQEKEDDEIIEEMILKNFNAKFKKTLSIADLLRKKEAKNVKEKMKKQVIKKPKYQNLIMESNNPLVIKHKFHPASKLHKLDPEEKLGKGINYFHHLDNIEQEYKISIKCPGTIRVPRNFAKFYSGGPKVNQSEPLYGPSKGEFRKPTVIELKAIIHIQSRLRGLMARSRFKRLIENHRNKNFVEAQERIFSKHTHKLQKKKEEGDSSPDTKKSFSPTSFYTKKMLQYKKISPNSNSNLQQVYSTTSIASDDQGNLKELPDSSRENKIRNREPPKSLLLKHRKLLEAAYKDNFFMVNNSGFIYYPSDVNIRDKTGNTALYYTASTANKQFTIFLLKHGGKPNLSCSEGNTPLHMAFQSNDVDIIMMLLEHGGDLNRLNHKAQTPLAFGSRYLLEMLDLTGGIASVNDRNSEEMKFDNNKLLFKVPDNDRIKIKEELGFKLDELRRSTIHVKEKNKLVEFSRETKK